MKDIIERLLKIENGFKPIEVEALNIFKSKTIDGAITLSCELLKHEKYQVQTS